MKINNKEGLKESSKSELFSIYFNLERLFNLRVQNILGNLGQRCSALLSELSVLRGHLVLASSKGQGHGVVVALSWERLDWLVGTDELEVWRLSV